MYKGNPKLVSHDKTCYYCKTLYKNIIETWEVYNFARDFHVCADCSSQIKKENEENESLEHKNRLEKFADNLNFLANEIGWIKNEAGQWYNERLNQFSLAHPISAEKPDDLLKYVPQGWILRYDDEDMMAYDSRVNLELPIELRYMNNPRYFYSLILDHHGFSSEQSLIQDILEIIVQIRKLEK